MRNGKVERHGGECGAQHLDAVRDHHHHVGTARGKRLCESLHAHAQGFRYRSGGVGSERHLEPAQRQAQIAALLAALNRVDMQLVITYPNADAGSSEIIAALERYAEQHGDKVRLIKNAGARLYFDLLACASAMVGNSSSGIAEAPSFELPAVNIGTRQAGFERAANVLDVGYGAEEIVSAIRRATTPEFRAGLEGLRNPYGEGRSSERIVGELRSMPLDDRLLRKKFVDWTPAP